MVFELLKVFTGINKPTDRDSFKFKRVEMPGSLLYDLFKEYYTLQQRNIFLKIDKEFYYKESIYQDNFQSLIKNNYTEFFGSRIVEEGFKKAFKGNWGSETRTKRLGIVQDVNRLSFNSYISIMRKINLPLDSSAKVVGPRLLHSSQWGIIDPVDTPDGGNIGLHKYMSILTKITKSCSSYEIIKWMQFNTSIELLNECSFSYLGNKTKLFINGTWIGIVGDPLETYNKLIFSRRNAIINIYTSITWNIKLQTINIFTDSGRMCHPVYYVNNRVLSIKNEKISEIINTNNFTWTELISGFNKKIEQFNINECRTYINYKELYPTSGDDFHELSAIIEYIDTNESETALICINESELDKKPYTHMEIHPSLIFGVMGNQIVFPENNPLPRDLFSCGQGKQAISLYHTNFTSRFDKTSLILNYGQTPLVKSRYLKYINNEEHPSGINVIVAIACYGGYNVEDSILFNKASIDRGLFRNTYYNTYEAREDSSSVGNSQIDSKFANIENINVIGLKPGHDYSDLDDTGLIKNNVMVDDKKVMIGKVLTNISNPDISLDASIFTKKGQMGFVDKTYITDGEQGFRLAKVRIRDERIPAVGDKFSSRCGQKGTIGLVVDENNMPFTAEGVRPDIIINPHALPSRMTIGQLLETVMGKASTLYGTFAECTAFNNTGSKYSAFGKLLSNAGFNSSANEILYNGETGEQMILDIFIGPTYYMRLKHMVKDKINYRAKGPRTVLTRQTVQGRANDGGLRVGEQEKDAIVAHGLSYFLKESMLVRGDEFFMAVCNLTGMTAIYNTSLNLFISPFADGPVQFVGKIADSQKIDKITKYGRSFSIVRIPYAFKLLIQELTTLNINMRIITDQNIDHLSSMNPINKITQLDEPDLPSRAEPYKSTKQTLISPSLSVKETQDLSDQLLDKTISENILDLPKMKKDAEQEDLDDSELLEAFAAPKLIIGNTTTFKPDQLMDGIPDINTTPLIGKTSDTTDKTLQFTLKPDLEKSNTAFDDPTISEKLESKDLQNLSQSDLVKPKTIVTSAIDDPETADELESNQLQLLTNFKVEDNPQNESSNEKSIDIK